MAAEKTLPKTPYVVLRELLVSRLEDFNRNRIPSGQLQFEVNGSNDVEMYDFQGFRSHKLLNVNSGNAVKFSDALNREFFLGRKAFSVTPAGRNACFIGIHIKNLIQLIDTLDSKGPIDRISESSNEEQELARSPSAQRKWSPSPK